MPLKLNNVEDIFAHNVFLLNSQGSGYDEVRDLINAGGGGGSGLITSVSSPLSVSSGNLSINLLNYITSSTLSTTLSGYTDTTGLNNILANYTDTAGINTLLSNYTDNTGLTNLLANKQDLLTSGTGISISNNIITGLELQVDGVRQYASVLNFVQNNSSLVGNVLNVSRLTHYDKIPLIYSNQASIKDLSQGASGELLWNGLEVQLKQNAFQQINTVLPLSASGANTITIESLFKPSTVSGNDLTILANDSLGTLSISVDTNTIATVSSMNLLLSNKQDVLTPGSNITISNNTISATGDATQAWVSANFLSPLNPGTLGTTAGLSSVMTANTFIISVDENTDSRTKLILRDSNNTARDITANLSGQLVYNNNALATETQLNTKQNTLSTGAGAFLSGATISGYDLRWNHNGVPSGPIECLHFKSGLDITQALNTTSGQVELQIEGRTDIADITGLQNEMNKITDLVPNGVSGVSLGTGSGSSQRMAVYEIEPNQTLTPGHYFYGVGLFEGQSQGLGVGLGLWGGTGTNLPDQFGTGGTQPHMLISINGDVGIGNRNPSQKLDVVGNCTITGTCTASSFPTSSDQSIKDNIDNADYQEIQGIFNSIDVKTYTRNDGVEGSRIGFIANDFDNNISQDSKFQNIVHKIKKGGQTLAREGGAADYVEVEEEENYILGLDYSRLCALLWGVCKNQESRIQALEKRISNSLDLSSLD